MPSVSTIESTEKLAEAVEKISPSMLGEIYSELFPRRPPSPHPPAKDIAKLIRDGLEPEELVDLWNVVFPEDRNVWYNEETQTIYYNEELIGYPD